LYEVFIRRELTIDIQISAQRSYYHKLHKKYALVAFQSGMAKVQWGVSSRISTSIKTQQKLQNNFNKLENKAQQDR